MFNKKKTKNIKILKYKIYIGLPELKGSREVGFGGIKRVVKKNTKMQRKRVQNV